MRSFLGSVPLLAALFLSATPVQAYGTWEELDKACEASDEALKLCIGVAGRFSADAGFSMLCKLREDGAITPGKFNAEYNRIKSETESDFEGILKVFWNSGIEKVLEDYPKCPIKPIP